MTTIGTCPSIWPNVPLTNRSGAKAAMVVNTPINTGPKTPCTPAIDALGPTNPASRSAIIFSPTMTASSTTTPRHMINANSEIILILTSKYPRNKKAPKKEIGTPIATQKANRRSSIKTKNRNTSVNPSAPFLMRRLNRDSRISV